jgi:hypothetical protein
MKETDFNILEHIKSLGQDINLAFNTFGDSFPGLPLVFYQLGGLKP